MENIFLIIELFICDGIVFDKTSNTQSNIGHIYFVFVFYMDHRRTDDENIQQNINWRIIGKIVSAWALVVI